MFTCHANIPDKLIPIKDQFIWNSPIFEYNASSNILEWIYVLEFNCNYFFFDI